MKKDLKVHLFSSTFSFIPFLYLWHLFFNVFLPESTWRVMFHVTSAQVESQTAHIDTPKSHLSPTDQDNHAKIAQQIANPELVLSETPQVVVHSETSEKEDNYENSLAAAGTPVRVVQAFTLLQESPEAQVCLSDLVWQMFRHSHIGYSSFVFIPFSCYHQAWI